MMPRTLLLVAVIVGTKADESGSGVPATSGNKALGEVCDYTSASMLCSAEFICQCSSGECAEGEEFTCKKRIDEECTEDSECRWETRCETEKSGTKKGCKWLPGKTSSCVKDSECYGFKDDLAECAAASGNDQCKSKAGGFCVVSEDCLVEDSTCEGSDGKCADPVKKTVTSSTEPCFPSSATVTKADGTAAPVSSIAAGDAIAAVSADGVVTTDTVSILSVAMPDATAPMIALSAGNATLTLTEEHHLPVGEACCSELKQAKNVLVGDTVWMVHAGAPPRATTVTAKSPAAAPGLHSPVLTHGGFPIVDGFVTSFDTIEKVVLAKHGLAPLEALCKASGSCEMYRDMFLGGDRKYI